MHSLFTGRFESTHEWLEHIKNDADFMKHITNWKVISPKEAKFEPLPDLIEPELKQALEQKGMSKLYTHQAETLHAAIAGQHTVTVTPTASGKTLCYNLPVLNHILKDEHARSLYIFPTKALAQDQVAELQTFADLMDFPLKTYTYDGDTPPTVRTAIRQSGHIVVTNPDMLHSAILPHHTKWVKLFENLKYIIIDEVHAYRGVFGSHFANVLRRLKRICRFYGSEPQFICASATIDNPGEHAAKLIGEPITVINNNGAPAGEKHFLFYNPPVVNEQLGIRRSSVLETQKLAKMLIKQGLQTIVFARSRVRVELLLTYLQDTTEKKVADKTIRGYRGGYLPKLRREIEHGLRTGEIRAVVSTNALELGIDIGQLQACILNGYPGTIASTWQQSGRAGRRHDVAVTIMVASSSPLDQFIVQNPDYFFNRPPEQALIDPDNVLILLDHIKCAAYELPFTEGEQFGGESLADMLEFLMDEKVVHHAGNRWYWMEKSFPAHNISLRTAAGENIVVIDMTEKNRVIGEVDRFSAPTLVHEEAIYIHEGVQYQVEKLDYEEKKAYVRQVDVDYYTDANMAIELKVLHEDLMKEDEQFLISYGEVTINAQPTIFKKIRLRTHENIGSGPIHLPEEELHSASYWFSFKDELASSMSKQDMQSALMGIANIMQNLAPLYLMCDPFDIRVVPQVKAVHTGKPTIFFYDRYPGGIGLSRRLYDIHDELMDQAIKLLNSCGCLSGCPACVGPIEEVGLLGKTLSKTLLQQS